MKTKPQRVLERYKQLKEEKQPWLPVYQLLSEYVFVRKQDFITTKHPGQFLYGRIYDGTAGNANHLMASSLLGALWPSAKKAFKIDPPADMKGTIKEREEHKRFYEYVTHTMTEVMDNPKCGLPTALEEYMTDQGAFGISGIGSFDEDSYDTPIRYIATDVKYMCVDENNRGFVDVVYIEREMTLRQLIQEYGYDNISNPNKKLWDDGKCNEKVVVLHAIEPRLDKDPYRFGADNMPVASIHIEVETQKVLKESGFAEMPVFVSRFWKLSGEKQGRSPAMEALADILEMNAIREAYTLAHEKNLDPPLLVSDDCSFGGGTIDTSAGAINVYSPSGRLGTNNRPAEPLITVGELQSTITRIAELREIIKNHWFIDRLLDLNNETRMTLGEAQMRYEFRGQSLAPVYVRQISELFVPLIERTFNLLLRKGMLGVARGSKEELAILADRGEPAYIPDEIAKRMKAGKDVYKITFISPAARIIQSEELMGIQRTMEFAMGVASINPEILDNIDLDETIRRVQDLTGAPSEIIVALETVRKVREARQQQQAAMAELEASRAGSETARNVAQANQMMEQTNGAA